MEIRVFIISLACLSCLVPPSLGMVLTKAAAIGAAKVPLVGIKAVAIGAGAGLAVKGAVALLAKKALLGILLKAAALKGGALIAKKKLAIKGGALAMKGLGGAMAAANEMDSIDKAADSYESDGPTTTTKSPLRDILSGTARIMQSVLTLGEAAGQKSRAIYRVMSTMPRFIARFAE